MKKICSILWIVMWSFIGFFIGYSGFQYYDFKKYPDLYAMRSAPWYLEVELLGIITAIIVVALLAVMWFLKRKIKNTETIM